MLFYDIYNQSAPTLFGCFNVVYLCRPNNASGWLGTGISLSTICKNVRDTRLGWILKLDYYIWSSQIDLNGKQFLMLIIIMFLQSTIQLWLSLFLSYRKGIDYKIKWRISQINKRKFHGQNQTFDDLFHDCMQFNFEQRLLRVTLKFGLEIRYFQKCSRGTQLVIQSLT